MSNFITAVFDSVSNLLRVAEQNPLNQQYVAETVIDESVPVGAANYYYIDVNGYKTLGLTCVSATPANVSITLRATTGVGDPSGLSYPSSLPLQFSKSGNSVFANNIDEYDQFDVAGATYIRVDVLVGTAATDVTLEANKVY